MKIRYLLSCLIFFMAVIPQGFVLGDIPDTTQEMVYTGLVFNGIQYISVLSPAEKDTFYLLADTDNAITLKSTEIYYWETTQEYKANWDESNEVINGKLEVYHDSKLIYQTEQTHYVVSKAAERTFFSKIFFGQNAENEFLMYSDKLKKYNADYQEYLNLNEEYSEEMWDRFEHPEKYKGVSMPEEPNLTEPLNIYVTVPAPAFKINLPEGEYSMWVVDDSGKFIKGSEKKLKVFSEIQRGVSYIVYTDQAWTNQLASRDENEAIYTGSASSLFLQPFIQYEYYAADYLNLTKPQNKFERADYVLWLDIQPISEATLDVYAGSNFIVEKQLVPFIVKQSSGNHLGYEIIPISDSNLEGTTFKAFHIDLQNEDINKAFIKVHGQLVDGGSRSFVNIDQRKKIGIFLPAFLTFGLGIVIVQMRKYKTRRNH